MPFLLSFTSFKEENGEQGRVIRRSESDKPGEQVIISNIKDELQR